MRTLKHLHDKLLQLKVNIERDAKTLELHNEKISNWSVSEHHDHLLKSELHVLPTLLNNEKVEGPPISLAGRAVLLVGKIPPNRKSPEKFLAVKAKPEELRQRIEMVVRLLEQLRDSQHVLASKVGVLAHPALGTFTSAQWIKFLLIHRRHHERIIEKIIKSLR